MSATIVGLPNVEPERYLTVAEFAALLGVSVPTVRRWITAGMPSETWGARLRRIRPSIALAWLRSREYAEGELKIAPATVGAARGHGPGDEPSVSTPDPSVVPFDRRRR
jgi:excisionase family DNA binding protein